METEDSYQPDLQWENIGIEIKSGVHGLRNLRSGLLGLAYWLTNHPENHGLLLLVDSRITEKRLQQEMQLARNIFSPALSKRIAAALYREGTFTGLPADLGENFRSWIGGRIVQKTPGRKTKHAFFDILEILIHQWLLGRGPMTTDWLMKTAGCSYPTAAGALHRLEYCLRRHSDRRVELRYFPREEWARLIAVADSVRMTTRFADRSGKPRSVEDLMERLRLLQRDTLAIGGIPGARHYAPGLDIVGTPRLDLSLHCPDGNVKWDFIGTLDPALQETGNRSEPAVLVVHVVRRAASLFQHDTAGMLWADPVECLLDLHEARLEPQALELLRSFPDAKGV